MTKVLSVGIATVDTIVLVDNYPAANERVVAVESIRAVGGPATTAAVTMARQVLMLRSLALSEMTMMGDSSSILSNVRGLIPGM